MRVSILGQAAFGAAALKRLQDDGVDIGAVSAPAPSGASRPDPLWVAAEAAGLPLVDTAALKTAEGLARWHDFETDLGVMAFVTEILPDDALTAPRLGTIQYHPSLLPLHRGSSAINWPIIFGRHETGLTIFWPDQGIDTGPILLQKRCPIGPDDTVGSLYFDKLFPMGIDALAEAVRLVRDGKAPRIGQDHRIATYEPPCREKHGTIPWHAPAGRVYALIRGCNPQPGAWTTYDGTKLSIFDSRLTGDEEPGMPGRVLRVDDDGFDVRLNGGVLRVQRVQPEGAKKLPAGEWARSARLTAGARFR
jgi:methionyl-tRNA formyltransferase